MSYKSPLRMIQQYRRSREAALGVVSAATYADKVIATGPIAYWILGETVGLTAVEQINSPAQDGTYTGVTLGQTGIGDGNTAPLFDGANDFVDMLTGTFASAFDGGTGSMMIWGRVFNAGVWTDAAFRRMGLVRRTTATAYLFSIVKNNVNNQVLFQVNGYAPAIGGQVSTGWQHYASTWDIVADEAIVYIDGANVGGPSAALNPWGGGAVEFAFAGALTNAPSQPWYGWLAHFAIWDSVLSPATVATLATV